MKSGFCFRPTISGLLAVLLFLGKLEAAEIQSIQMLADRCKACHGVQFEGDVKFDAPALAGLNSWYIERQLLNFKKGIRGVGLEDVIGNQMRSNTITLTSVEIVKLSKRISRIQSLPQRPSLVGNKSAGENHFSRCATCHGRDGRGNQGYGILSAPNLSNQPDWYIVRQLKNFRNGLRGTHPKDAHGNKMRQAALNLPDDQAIYDVAAWISSLK